MTSRALNENVNNLDASDTLEVGQSNTSSVPQSADGTDFRSFALQIHCVGKGLYLSGFTGASNREQLRRFSITHILNVAKEFKDTVYPEFVDVRFAGFRDADGKSFERLVPELVEHIHQIIDSGGRIVVHCMAGVSRSASMCLAYKVCHEHLSLREAFDEVFKARPIIFPDTAFWPFLVQWERMFRDEDSVLMRPYICGMVPEMEMYEHYTWTRIKLIWIEEMRNMWILHMLLLLLQIVFIVLK